MLILVTVCLLVWICVLTYWRARFVESHAHPLPPVYPGYIPIIGHTHMLLTDASNLWLLVKDMTQYSLQQGGLIFGKVGSHIYYIISDPEDCFVVANTCLEKHFLHNFAKCMLGEGLITGSGHHWRRHRELLKSNFSLPIINSFLEVFNSQSRALLSDVECYVGKEQFYISPHLEQLTLGTSYLTTFGKVANEIFYSKYIKAVDEMLALVIRRFQKFWLQNDFIYKLLGEKQKESELVKTANEVTNEVKLYELKKQARALKERLKQGDTISPTLFTACFVDVFKLHDWSHRGLNINDVPYQPFIDLMLEQNSRNNFTDQEITDELHTNITAAFETTAHSLQTIIIMIGSFPKVQEKMYEEIMQVLGSDRDIHKDDLRKLVYTDAVIKESLRVLPTVPVSLRFVDSDVKLKNYTLRAGSQCVMSLLGLLHHPSWGPDAEVFRPERWLDTATLPTKIATGAFFGTGKRSCLGKIYAMTSMKVTIAHMVRRYIISADHTKLRFKIDMTLKAVSGHNISLQRRII